MCFAHFYLLRGRTSRRQRLYRAIVHLHRPLHLCTDVHSVILLKMVLIIKRNSIYRCCTIFRLRQIDKFFQKNPNHFSTATINNSLGLTKLQF